MKKLFLLTFASACFLNCQKKTSFTCDNPDLIKSVEQQTGELQNIITVSKDDELKTCNCEAYAPHLNHYTSNSVYSMTTGGQKFYFTAQMKENGQFVWKMDSVACYLTPCQGHA